MNKTIAIKDIAANPFQSRQEDNPAAIEALAQSIKSSGFWETNLRVRPTNGTYQLVWGHQRLAALRKLGRKEVAVDVVELDDVHMAEESLIENLQRTNLLELDKAESIARLLDMLMARPNGTRAHAIARICTLLGYQTEKTVEDILAMTKLSPPTKAVVRQHNVGYTVIRVARYIGGEKMVKHAAQARIGYRDLEPMLSELKVLTPESRNKVVDKIIADKITKADEVKVLVRREQERITHKNEIPPDLLLFIEKWSMDLDSWTKKLKAAAKHRDYIREHPHTATKFKDAAERFIAALKDCAGLK